MKGWIISDHNNKNVYFKDIESVNNINNNYDNNNDFIES